MDDMCPMYVLLYDPRPAMDQWVALWCYAAGLATTLMIVAVGRVWR
jgi:hypothetical protein